MTNKQGQTSTTTCDRCGMVVYFRHRTSHAARCAELPTPLELASRLLSDPEAKVTRMAVEYQGYVSRSFTERVDFGLTQMGYPPAAVLARQEKAQTDDENKRPCPHCGMFFHRLDLHAPRCQHMPQPLDLALEFTRNKMLLVELGEKYNDLNPTLLRDRLWHGLRQLGVYHAPKALSAQHKMERDAEEARLIAEIQANMVACRVCGVNIHASPSAHDDLCGWCAAERAESVQKFEISGTIVLLCSGKTLEPFLEVIPAPDKRRALRVAAARVRAVYGEEGSGWRWQSQPVVNV